MESPTVTCRSRASRGSPVSWSRNSVPPIGLISGRRAGNLATLRSSPSKKASAACELPLSHLKHGKFLAGAHLPRHRSRRASSSGRVERNPIESPHVSGRRHGPPPGTPILKKYHGPQIQRWLFGAWTALVFAFLYIPILLLIIFSFNSSRLNIRWEGFSLKWYGALLENSDLLTRSRTASSSRSRRRCSRRCSAPSGRGCFTVIGFPSSAPSVF